MILKIISILSFVCLALADPIPFKDCGSSGVTNVILDLSNCSALPCTFQKNQNVTLNLKFTSSFFFTIFSNFFLILHQARQFKSLKNLVYGIIAGVKVPFPLEQADACKNGIQCPVDPNIVLQEALSLVVLPEYPSISLFVQFQVNDENNEPAVCTLFPAKIQ